MTTITAEVRSTTAAFHDRLAPSYDAAMERDPGNVWVREAFRDLVSEVVEPNCAVLDFGCGTGEDSRWLAARGHRVFAYDNSEGMITALRDKCRAEIKSGTIIPLGGEYEAFLTSLQQVAPCRAVVANFAVLNMISDMRPLFAALGGWLPAGSNVVVSVLNPFYWRELKRPGHLRTVWQTLRIGTGVRRGDVETHFHSCQSIQKAARPEFTLQHWAGVGSLVSIERGQYDWHSPLSRAQRIEKRWWRSAIGARTGKFWFLVFRRNA